MIRPIVLLGGAMLLGLGAVPTGTSASVQPGVVRVQVHCPAGNAEAFVTPPQVRVRIGQELEWRMAGEVESDSIVISLKDAAQTWPFEGEPSRGASVARARGAATPGTYAYNVRLLCRVPPAGLREVIIDPDIIIEP